MACDWRAWADRVARSAVLTRGEPVTWDRHLRQPSQVLVGWGNLRVVTTGWRRVVTTRLAQGLALGRALRDCSRSTSADAASIRRAGPVAQLALGTGCDAGWGRVGICRARWLTGISSFSAAGFQEMWPVRAPA